MKKFIRIAAILAFTSLSFTFCSGKDNPEKEPEIQAPAEISFDQANPYEAARGGESLTLTITSPTRPTVKSGSSWVKVKDGTYDKYKIKIGLEIASNETFDSRSAEISVKAGELSKTFTISQPGLAGRPEHGSNEAWQMANKLGFGWNMGNQMEANDNGKVKEGIWTNTLATQATFDGIKAKGLKSVRIPISWMDQIGAAPEYKLGERLERVAELVGFANKAGLITIINIHHDDNFWLSLKDAAASESRRQAISEEIEAVWRQIAERFKNEGDWLIFESFNEVHDGQWGWSTEYRTEAGKKKHNDILNGWNQLFVNTVRATGSNNSTRWLGVPGYCASPEFTLESFVLPEDPAKHVMVSFHEYTPYTFCQTAEASDWGHNRKGNKNDKTFDESYMESIFSQFYEKFVRNNVPVYLGEFGCANRPAGKAREFQLYYLEYLCKCARTYGMSAFIWDNAASNAGDATGNESYGMVDHGTGEYVGYGKMMFDACKKGMYTEDASYTLDTVYNNSPK